MEQLAVIGGRNDFTSLRGGVMGSLHMGDTVMSPWIQIMCSAGLLLSPLVLQVGLEERIAYDETVS